MILFVRIVHNKLQRRGSMEEFVGIAEIAKMFDVTSVAVTN